MATKFYLRSTANSQSGTLPANNASISATTPTQIANTSNFLALTQIGAAQTSNSLSTNGTSNSQPSVIQRWISLPLADGQTIVSQNIAFSGAASESNGGSNFKVAFSIALWRPSTGSLVGRITDLTVSTAEPGTGETAVSATTTGSTSQTTQDGDILIFELWRDSTVPGAATARTNTVYFNGTTEASTTNNAAFFNFPTTTLKFRYQGYGQAQAQIKAFDTPQPAQAQADITTTYWVFGQAQTWIQVTNFGLGQAQADIKATSFGLGQAQAVIKATGTGLAQALALIDTGTYPPTSDTFTRSVGIGLGTADTGGAWTTNASTSFSVNGSVGIYTDPDGLTIQTANLQSVSARALTRASVDFQISSLPTGITIRKIYLWAHQNPFSSTLGNGVIVQIDNAGTSTLSAPVGNSFAFLGQNGISIAANTTYRLIVEVNAADTLRGTSNTRIRAKLFDPSGTEPGWQFDGSSDDVLAPTRPQILGYSGLSLFNNEAGVTTTLDNWSSSTLGWTEYGQAQAKINAFNVNGFGQAQARIIYLQRGLGQAAALISGTATSVVDTFTRTTSNGWGTADTGGDWTIVAGTASDFATDGSVGTVSGLTENKTIALNSVLLSRELETYFKFSFSALPSSGSYRVNVVTLLSSRAGVPSSTIEGIGIRLNLLSTGVLRGDSKVSNGTQNGPDIAYTPGDFYWAKFKVLATTTGQKVWVKTWKDGTSEPADWDRSSESSVVVYPGHFAIETTAGASASVFTIDEINVYAAAPVSYAQAQATIVNRTTVYAQAQADIKAVSYGLSQANADIETTSFGLGQAQADIKQIYYGLAQAQGFVKGASWSFGQANSDIQATSYASGQAQAIIYIRVFYDDFERTVASDSLGSKDGFTYVREGGGLSDGIATASVDGHVAQIISDPSNNNFAAYKWDRWKLHKGMGQVDFRIPNTHTGELMKNEFIAFFTNASDDAYIENIDANPPYQVQMGMSKAIVSPAIITGFQFGTWYTFKWFFSDTDGDIARIKVWPTGTQEPDWMETGTESPNYIWGNAGFLRLGAVRFDNGGGYTPDTTEYDNLTLWNAYRSVETNGFAQAQATIAVTTAYVSGQSQALINGQYTTVSDDFQRTVATGLGTATSGDTYVVKQGSDTNASVDGTSGVLVTTTSNQIWELQNTLISGNTEITFDISVDKIPASSSILFQVISHYGSIPTLDANYLQAQIALSSAGNLTVSSAIDHNGGTTGGASPAQIAYTVNDVYRYKAHFISTSSGAFLRTKVWKVGTTEPGWSQSSITNEIPTAGHVQIRVIGASVANAPFTWKIDNLNISQANLTYYAQAQADIVTSYQGYGQAQADILATSYGLAQSQSDIKAIGYGLGQAQSDIKQTYFGLAQAQASIKQTYFGLAQAQAYITETNFGLGQAQSDIKQVYWGLGQSQADIRTTYFGLGQANADILAQGYGLGQANTDILAQGYGEGQSQADIKTTYFGLAQAQGSIKATSYGLGQSNADILAQNYGFGQSNADILAQGYGEGQAQADILQTYFGLGQANADILATSFGLAQAQADIKATSYGEGQAQAKISVAEQYRFGQANADIKSTSFGEGQAQAYVLSGFAQIGQAQADILARSYGLGQSNADILVTSFGLSQSQADIKITTQSCAQANALIRRKESGLGQAQSDIKATSTASGNAQADVQATYNGLGQAQADVRAVSYGEGQSQAYIKLIQRGYGQAQATIRGNAFGQANADILVTTSKCANAQALIRTTVNSYGQSQANITNRYFSIGQAQANILSAHSGFGQAQGLIRLIDQNQHGQAQAWIIKAAGYGQAQALIFQPHILKNFTITDRHSLSFKVSDLLSTDADLDDRPSMMFVVSDRHSLDFTISDRPSMSLTNSDREY